ncbi:MAG TPA: purine-nucleoside phosphorylase [Gemmatimonadaceae bacterium]|nr:purine-nucleoside phosphorylase [Gemmatimonadaceae bacterium]
MTIPRERENTAEQVARRVHETLKVDAPVTGMVLGSGLSGLARRIEAQRFVRYSDIPGFATPTVPGHLGQLISGTLAGRPVLALCGRFHVYEGYSAAEATFPIRVLRALGAHTLLLSNAAGGLRRTMKAGDLMIIRDHMNLTGTNPLIGPVVPGDERFPDMSDPWDPRLRALLAESANAAGVPVTEGVYCGLTGPSYETPAEVRMLEKLGADAVGMSTVHEVIVARAIGMRVAGMSCITNLAAGLSDQMVSHEDVLEVTKRAGAEFEKVAIEFVSRL